MQIITVDFETYYDADYSLKKVTTEEYIRDPRFEVICVAVKVGDEKTRCFTGDFEQTGRWLEQFDWENSAVLAQNTMFDGAILHWLFGHKAKLYVDTMLMSYAVDGPYKPASLAALAKRWLQGREKGDEVENTKGKRRTDFGLDDMLRFKEYCINDVDATYEVFCAMLESGFPKKELKLIDVTLRMFIDPVLKLDKELLQEHLANVAGKKEKLLSKVSADPKQLTSNPKFAELLREYGVEPPMKVSKTTGKETFAFAKTDQEFLALQEHPDPVVQALVAARLGVKSTLEETRTQRFIDMATRGLFPVPLKYCGAGTHRWSGLDGINLQNLPSRGGKEVKALKRAIMAKDGHVIIESDSSQIEARVLAFLAGQEDLVETFRENNKEILAGVPKAEHKHDPYKRQASQIYDIGIADVTPEQRQLGKTVLLGSGYGLGWKRFAAAMELEGIPMDEDMAKHIINVYRSSNYKIPEFWRAAQYLIEALYSGEEFDIGEYVGTLPGLIKSVPGEGVLTPSGLIMRYDRLHAEKSDGRWEFWYYRRNEKVRLYGPKMVENICQNTARCIIGEQILQIAKYYRVALTVHDSVVVVVPQDEVDEALEYVKDCMMWAPKWIKGVPLMCEAGYNVRYGDCE